MLADQETMKKMWKIDIMLYMIWVKNAKKMYSDQTGQFL